MERVRGSKSELSSTFVPTVELYLFESTPIAIKFVSCEVRRLTWSQYKLGNFL